DVTSSRRGPFVNPLQQRRGVERMHRVETRAGLLGLVRLQMTDEMPADVRRAAARAERVDLRQRLLHLVLTEIDLAGRGGLAHVLDRKCFGNGDEADRGGVASRTAGGPRDARADVRQPCGDRGHFLMVPRMPFAVAAFGPVGASFRYVSNSPAAALRFPSLTSAIPS